MDLENTKKKDIMGLLLKNVPIVILFVFMFQLGQYNVHLTEQTIKEYCMPNINYSVVWSGQVALWDMKNNTYTANPTGVYDNGTSTSK